MNFRHLLRNALPLLALSFAACATEPEPRGGLITAVQSEDGTLKAVDENGQEVDSLEANLMLGLLQALQGPSLADDEIWSVDAEGNLTHIQSGGMCPYEWGEFNLVKPTIFRQDGSDVSCNFQSSTLNASYTFYFYRNAEPLDQELAGALNAIKTRSPTAQAAELNFLGPEPHFYVGQVLETEIDDGGVQRDAVLITETAGWRIKLRMTYSANDAVDREHFGALMLQGQVDRVGNNMIGSNPEDGETEPEIDT